MALPDDTPAVEVYYDSSELWPAASLERLQAIKALRAGPENVGG